MTDALLQHTYRDLGERVRILAREVQELLQMFPEWVEDPEEDAVLLDIHITLELILFELELIFETLEEFRDLAHAV